MAADRHAFVAGITAHTRHLCRLCGTDHAPAGVVRRCGHCYRILPLELDATATLACEACFVPDVTDPRYRGATEDFLVEVCRHPRRAWIDAPGRMPDGTIRRSCGACGISWYAAGRVAAPR